MRQAAHILRKDLRRLRWWLALWAALLAGRVLIATAWPLDAGHTFDASFLVDQLRSALGVATFVLFGILTARLVHDEPLVGLDWFWLTRPYDRGSLLAAKLAFAVLVFVVLPLVAELVVMTAYGADARDMLRASSVFLARDGRWTLGLMIFAVLTPTLAGFALGLAATGAALSLAMLGVFAVAMLRFDQDTPPAAVTPDATQPVVATVVFLLACLAVIVYQYRRRRRGRALAIAAVGLAAVVFVPSIWPWRIAPVITMAPPAFAQDTAGATVLVDRTSPPEIIDQPPLRRRDGRRRSVLLPIEVAGLPGGYRAQGTYAETRLELTGGEVLEGRQTGAAVAILAGPSGFDGERRRHLQGVLGEVRVLPVMPEPAARPRVTVLTVTDEQLMRHGTEPGRLVSTFRIPLQHSRAVGALPLAAGERLRLRDTQLELVHVQRRHDGCTILLRQWRATSFLSPPEFWQLEFLLRNVERQEAYAASPQHRSFGASSFFFVSLLGLTLDRGRSGFSVEHLWMDYPPYWGVTAERHAIDAQWLAGADFVIVETTGAGTIMRTVTLDDFRMQEPASGVSP